MTVIDFVHGLSAETLRRLDAHWTGRLDLDAGVLARPGLHVVPMPQSSSPVASHAEATPSLERVYIVDLGRTVIAVAPERYASRLREVPIQQLVDRDAVARLLPKAVRLVGPAFIGYAEGIAAVDRALTEFPSSRVPAFDALRRTVTGEEWEHAGLDEQVGPIFASRVDGEVVAAAGFQILGKEVAHIGVLTHPAHRGGGHGRRVVAGAARCALSRGLLAQYQTLQANGASIAVAHALGFTHFATTMAARVPTGPPAG